MTNTELSLVPYLNFQGDCEDALNFYADCLGGEIGGIQRYDTAPGMEVPEHQKNKVLHARLLLGRNVLMASDVFHGPEIENGSRVQLVIELENEAATRSIFEKLAEGGEITMPLEHQFWGALYGKLVDRFGIAWMINCPLK